MDGVPAPIEKLAKKKHQVTVAGTSYQYDLNNPVDRIRYGVDPAAQLRDQHDPRVDIDRNNLNQYGGGAYH
ncbi:hypothetical protein ELY40_14985 [Vreelandella populi]|nr:hypothetical protein ELY40_14985 [Halomonas populi]